MNPINELAEVYEDGRFVPVEILDKGGSTIVFQKGEGENWAYFPDFSVSQLVDGGYQTLDLENEKWDGNELKISVPAGQYKVITDNRLPNGNIFASRYIFVVGEGETKTVKLEKYHADLADMLDNFTLDEFKVSDENGNTVKGSELTKNPAVLMWLEQGREPTEHILNEMLEQEADFQNLSADIIFYGKRQGSPGKRQADQGPQHLPKDPCSLRHLRSQCGDTGPQNVCGPGEASSDHRYHKGA